MRTRPRLLPCPEARAALVASAAWVSCGWEAGLACSLGSMVQTRIADSML